MEPTIQGCGPYPDGNFDVISYRQGKRCWLNKVVFGVKSPEAQMTQPAPIQLGAGDSSTDLFFVRDATDLHVVINRNKVDLMCHSLANQDGRWVVAPMFIEPNPRREKPYSCSHYGLPDQPE